MAIPTKDADFVAWVDNCEEKLSAPEDFGLTAAQAAQFTTLYNAFKAAYLAAQNPSERTKSKTATKQQTKRDLLDYARELYAFVQASLTVPNDKKVSLGVLVPDREPSIRPAPALAPALSVVRIYGREIRLEITDATGQRKGRAAGCDGAALYSFVGPNPPEGAEGWQPEGNVFKRHTVVQFPNSVAPGTKVWFTAQWYNTTGTGPGCSAVSAHIGFEGTQPLAA